MRFLKSNDEYKYEATYMIYKFHNDLVSLNFKNSCSFNNKILSFRIKDIRLIYYEKLYKRLMRVQFGI